MTYFGKVLIFLNLMLSVIFAGWAVGIYTNRIDWAPAHTLFGDPIEDRPGRVAILGEEVKGSGGARDLAEARWQYASVNLTRQEQHRIGYQQWYAQELATVRTGIGADGKEAEFPVRQLIRDPQTGDLEKDPVKDKKKADTFNDEPLKALDYYNEQYKDLVKKLDDLQKEYNQMAEKARKQAVEINGIPGKVFGLRNEVLNLKSYLRNATDEMVYLRPLYDSTDAELNTMRKRNLALEKRLKELKELAAVNR